MIDLFCSLGQSSKINIVESFISSLFLFELKHFSCMFLDLWDEDYMQKFLVRFKEHPCCVIMGDQDNEAKHTGVFGSLYEST